MFPSFREIVVLDTEFHTFQALGNKPVPICLCAVELRSGKKHRVWLGSGQSTTNPLPDDALYVAFSSSAEGVVSSRSVGVYPYIFAIYMLSIDV